MVTYRHKKRGTTYRILGPALVHCSEPILDDESVFVYLNKNKDVLVVFAQMSPLRDLVGIARAQSEEPILDGEVVVVYQDIHSNALGVRPPEEFNDGRFEKITDEVGPADC